MRTQYQQTWESEQRLLGLDIGLDGAYYRSHSGDQSRESKRHSLSAQYSISGRWNQYLAGGPFSVQLTGHTQRQYSEHTSERRLGDEWDDLQYYQRSYNHSAYAGFGFGHLRNVVPLLRAQRLSERLAALERPPLTPRQIRDLSQVLATEYAYRQVFDRADRHFWDDVLSPLLEPNHPLSPYEVFYLADVLNEDLGHRFEGFQLRTGFSFRDDSSNFPRMGIWPFRRRSPEVDFCWYHNLSLTQQIMVSTRYLYGWENRGTDSFQMGILDFSLEHLWNMTDRINLETGLHFHGYSRIVEEERSRQVTFSSNLDIYLEDQLSLSLNTMARYSWSRELEEENIGWDLVYRLGLVYHIDRAIF